MYMFDSSYKVCTDCSCEFKWPGKNCSFSAKKITLKLGRNREENV